MTDIVHVPFIGYLQIATQAHEALTELISNRPEVRREVSKFPDTARGQATITIIFSVIALESFILDYAARRLGRKYAKRHIESLSLHSKWLLVPKLATGRELSVSDRGIQLLLKLVKARNSVVHLKAINIEAERWEEIRAHATMVDRELLEAAVKAFECIGDLGKGLCDLDPDEKVGQVLAGFVELPKYSIRFD